MTYLVSSGTGYTVRSHGRDEIHTCETHVLAYCCDRGCAIHYMRAIGVPIEVVTDHPLRHGAGDFIDLSETDTRGDSPVYSWGEYPCPETSCHEYCPACGALTVHGIEDDSEHSCDGWECDFPSYVEPDPCMA